MLPRLEMFKRTVLTGTWMSLGQTSQSRIGCVRMVHNGVRFPLV